MFKLTTQKNYTEHSKCSNVYDNINRLKSAVKQPVGTGFSPCTGLNRYYHELSYLCHLQVIGEYMI